MKKTAGRLLSSLWFRILAGIVLSAVTLYLVFRNVSFPDLWLALAMVEPKWILLALASVIVNTLFKVSRWKVLMGQPGVGVRWSQALLSFLAGWLINWVYPARLGDLSRAVVIGNQGPGKIFVLGSIALEKMIDAIWYVLLILWLLYIIPLPAWIQDPARGFALAAIVLVFLAILVVIQRNWLEKGMDWFSNRGPGWLTEQLRSRLVFYMRSGLSSLDVLRTGWRMWLVAFWSVVIWMSGFLTTFFVVLSMQIPLQGWGQRIVASFLVLVTLQAGVSLPSVPGRFGVFEYTCVLALGIFGIERSLASGFGLLLHGVILIPSVAAGIISILLLSRVMKFA